MADIDRPVRNDAQEVADETGIAESSVNATDPYDDRWGQVWERSYEIRGGSDWDEKVRDGTASDGERERADQQAFKEIFG